MTQRIVDDDIVRLYDEGDPKRLVATVFWGDQLEEVADGPVFSLPRAVWDAAQKRYDQVQTRVKPRRAVRFRAEPLLKVRFVDVGQGDATMIETPEGKRILIDGGEGPWIRRYVRVAFAHLLADGPIDLDAVVVSHGDADHFAGLTELLEAGREAGGDGHPLVRTGRVLHNGLVKGKSDPERDAFGETRSVDGRTYVVDLVDDLREVADERLNKFFRPWKRALEELGGEVGDLQVRRTFYGDDAFDFVGGSRTRVEVLGPIVEEVDGVPALPFLRQPGSSSLSASHTVNGHSVILRWTYGNVRFLFGADLNEESEAALVERAERDGRSLEAEVFKVPHHGSADFSPRMFERVRPVVSVVSCGDETVAKEYIHPRAGLVGALGKYSRAAVERPLVYVTEMVAFFRRVRHASEHLDEPDEQGRRERELLNAYQKLAFGIVHVRTDGERVLVATHSGKDDQKESYAFRVDAGGEIEFEPPRIV